MIDYLRHDLLRVSEVEVKKEQETKVADFSPISPKGNMTEGKKMLTRAGRTVLASKSLQPLLFLIYRFWLIISQLSQLWRRDLVPRRTGGQFRRRSKFCDLAVDVGR